MTAWVDRLLDPKAGGDGSCSLRVGLAPSVARGGLELADGFYSASTVAPQHWPTSRSLELLGSSQEDQLLRSHRWKGNAGRTDPAGIMP